MRPVNLIPPEERHDRGPVRTGPIAYLLMGALGLVLVGVTLVVLTNNKIGDRKAEIADLQQKEAAAKARADELAPFAQFKNVEDQRTSTVQSLADSRFDWERVMRELALVIPGNVWLTELSGAVSGDVTTSGDATSSSGTTSTAPPIDAPSLTIKGCATGQDAVAGFLAALRDIDGVTRVGLSSSERPSGGAGSTSGASGGSGSGGSTDCRTRDFITQFEVVVAFDAVPAPQVPGAAPSTSAPPVTATASASTETAPASATTGTSATSP
jgi:Tfp pilus assembly protein PilN